MKNQLQNIQIIVFLFMSCLCLVGCSDDEAEVTVGEGESILPYNSSSHIYGTMGIQNEGLWEIVIDPATGQYSKILETEEIFGGLSSRIGALQLTAFERNERLYFPLFDNSKLHVQDLETFDITEISLRDTLLDKTVINPQVLRFGVDQNELYLMDTDKSIWKINLDSKFVNRVHEGIPVSNGTYVTNFFYIESTGNFLGMTNTIAFNSYSADNLFVFNPELPDSTAIISTKAISKGFGFIQHPVEKNKIYYIQNAQDDKGFRFMKMEINGNETTVSELSTSDLSINQLSSYLQTIHTSSNSYVLRGGSANFDTPQNNIYSIDLDSGELMQEVALEGTGTFLKLAGE